MNEAMASARPPPSSAVDLGEETSEPRPIEPRYTSSTEINALGISAEDQRRLSDLYDRLNRIDHYSLLGVTATDDTKTIKRAYFALAKNHHPDRWFRKEVGPLRPKIDAIFAAMTTAVETLSSAELRAGYDSYLREVLKTRMGRRQAMALEASRSWPAAAAAWAKIVEKLPNDPYVQHRYAYALLQARTGWATALGAATRAIDLDPTRAEYRITAASLYLAEGRDRNALAQLAVACELDPARPDISALHAALIERVSRER
jgi:tetratricopeptide (TPR) repeat protein